MTDSMSARTQWLPFDAAQGDSDRARIRALEAERARLAEQVLHLERVAHVGLMTSGLAHDLLNQVTAMLGTAELARMMGDPDSLRDGIDGVAEHARRMHETVEAFLDFVRRREGRVRDVPLSEVAAQVQRLVEPVARSKGVALLSVCPTHATVRADAQLLEQVVVNLVMNAVRAAAEGGGRVFLSATDGRPGRVRLTVRDTGPGMPAAVLARLFEPFVSGHGDSGGHGLGLYVARQIVDRLGGRICVESGASGTRIDVDLAASGAR